jgi:hypothetical protein
LAEKLKDPEFRKYLLQQVADDLKKTSRPLPLMVGNGNNSKSSFIEISYEDLEKKIEKKIPSSDDRPVPSWVIRHSLEGKELEKNRLFNSRMDIHCEWIHPDRFRYHHEIIDGKGN